VEAVSAEAERAGLRLPQALADYYAVAGSHTINEKHNRLRPIARLEWLDDRLIFMDENQRVAIWGIHRDDLAEDDPVVWQGVNGDENYRLSQFLMAMWQWTVTGEQEPPDGMLPEG
jgi:hypothetical protein